MALDDLLQAIEADAGKERRQAELTAAAQAAEVVDAARQRAVTLEDELERAAERASTADADRLRASARLAATARVRLARERAYTVVLDGIRQRLAGLPTSTAYRDWFASALGHALDVLPSARRVHVHERDRELAASTVESSAGDLEVVADLDTLGGLVLEGSDGRSVRNTFDERLGNADQLLRGRFAEWLAESDEDDARTDSAGVR